MTTPAHDHQEVTPVTTENDTPTIDGTAEEVSTELTIQQAPTNLFRTDDPVKVLARATETANALRDVISKQGLYVQIGDKYHITIEGWQTLGAMLGVTPVCEWTRSIEEGWEARVVAQTIDGRIIGAAEAQCVSSEGKPWNTAKGHAIRSMAQTRAASKALASVLRFVAVLGGYQGTPAEDAPREHAAAAPDPPPESERTEPKIAEDRAERIVNGIKALKLNYGQIDLMLGAAGLDALRARSAKALTERIDALTVAEADALEAEMKTEAERNV